MDWQATENVGLYSITLYFKILINYSYCDNRTEFKGEFLDVLNYYRIPAINRRAYYLQSQGSVERANATFKNRLSACQAEHGTQE